MTFKEYDTKFTKVISEVSNNQNGELMVKLGISALTLIKERVIETGVNAKGQKFAPYSTKPTLIGCKTFIQKSACQALLGSKTKRKELEWRTVGGSSGFAAYMNVSAGGSGSAGGGKGVHLAILPGGYKKIRELQGRQTDHVDFSVTNNMWNDINLISKQGDHQKGTVIIGARKEEEKKKLTGNTKRKGDILDLNPKEINDLYESYHLNTLQIFRNNGL